MVRYPHTATVTVSGTLVLAGEYNSQYPTTSEIAGRYEPSEGTTQVKTPDGEYTNIKGKFFTKAEVVTGAEKLTINGVDYKILYWFPYQTYSEIWLD